MRNIQLQSEADFTEWRNAARSLLQRDIAPEQVHWQARGATAALFDACAVTEHMDVDSPLRVPRRFIELGKRVILHRDSQRFALLYRVLWRLRNEPKLLDVAVDADVARLTTMAKAVQRDIHKMKAFVRFRAVTTENDTVYIAWFEPAHHILAAIAPFFMRRFANQRWSILTPDGTAHWDGQQLQFGPGTQRDNAPTEDALEELWRSYYASIFNPARVKVNALHAQMPKRYWQHLPEAPLIPELIANAQQRSRQMIEQAPRAPKRRAQVATVVQLPHADALEDLRARAAQCRACPLWAHATQTVFGVGSPRAKVMIVGEQPGDIEDLRGQPFVGPAGQLLDRALHDAGIDRSVLYVTNAVKHFKFEPRGKRRLHKKPSDAEIVTCRSWLEQERELLKPNLVVALGATAARSILARAVTVNAMRGRLIQLETYELLITVHPSYLLRVPDEAKEREYAAFVSDLKKMSTYLHSEAAESTS